MKRVSLLIVLATGVELLTPSLASAAGSPVNPPTNLRVVSETETTVTLAWSPSTSSDVTGYEAFEGLANSPSASTAANTTFVTLGNVVCGLQFDFSVEAIDSAGNASSKDPIVVDMRPCQADIQVVSDTPSVTHAPVGTDVTFTIVAWNSGPDAAEMYVKTAWILAGLAFTDLPDAVSCQGIGNDGSQCEYGWIPPGQTVTQTVTLRTQATSTGYVNDVACVFWPIGDDPLDDPDPSNDCAVATVQLDQEPPSGDSAGGSTGGGSNGGSGGVVVMGSSGSQPQPLPRPPVVSRPPLRVCVPYTFGYGQKAADRSQRTVRVRDIVALDGHCHGNRILIERASAVFSRKHAKSGIYVNVSSWRCRQLRVKGAWLDDCWQGPRALSWSETVVRTGEPAIGRSR